MSVRTITIDTNATSQSDAFPMFGDGSLTIEHSASGSSPNGTWTLEVYNTASAAWETVTAASGDFTNPAGSDASGVASFVNPPDGTGRIVYTRTGGGAAGGGTLVIRSIQHK